MQDLLVHSNPVLEAFGNAKTLRNDNSSRFGKLVTVHFDGSGRIMGAYTRNYLLERPRVANAPAGERNYHAFYQVRRPGPGLKIFPRAALHRVCERRLTFASRQTRVCVREQLLSGASDKQRADRFLSGGAVEHALLKGGVISAAGIDDVKEWREMCGSMRELGFSDEEQSALFDALAALLHLGNTTFVADSAVSHGDDAARLSSVTPVEHAAALLGADRREFVGALTGLRVRDQLKALSVEQAAKNRDAFVAAVYAQIFDWLVQRINTVGTGEHTEMNSMRFIGVLDIFGFEIFQTNSFEQLCINFANERLQRNFTSTTFTQEEGLYQAEGIPFEHIPYTDNLPILELLDCNVCAPPWYSVTGQYARSTFVHATRCAPPFEPRGRPPLLPPQVPSRRGIMQLIDEETRLPKTTDKTLLDKMNAQFAPAGPKNGASMYATDFRHPELFTVKHYAGDVVYAVKNFLEKSVENVSADLVTALSKSSKPLFANLFSQTSSRDSHAGGLSGSKSRKPTVGVKFATQLTSLVDTIEQTSAHFIRCIKPNAQKSADLFETKLTLEQYAPPSLRPMPMPCHAGEHTRPCAFVPAVVPMAQ